MYTSATATSNMQERVSESGSLRVLALSTILPNPLQPTRGVYNLHQLKALSTICSVRAIAPILWTEELSVLARTFRRIGSGRQSQHGNLVVDHPRFWYFPRFFPSLHGCFFAASVKQTFMRVVKEFNPDVIFSPWIYPDGWAAVELATLVRRPVVVKALGSDIMLLKENTQRHLLTQETLVRANEVVAVSKSLATRMEKLGINRNKISVVYRGIDRTVFMVGNKGEARTSLGINEKKTIFIAAGNLVEVKGFDLLLEACSRIDSSILDWQLHVLGGGPLKSRLRQLALKLGISDRVHFQGAVAQNVLATWMQAADLYVLSSRSEGIPNVLRESIASQLPYVATDVGGVRELDEFGGGLVVPPNSPEHLYAGMMKALAAPPRLSANVIPSWQTSAESLLQILWRVCRRKSPC